MNGRASSFRALRRQLPLALVLAVLATAAIVGVCMLQRNVYSSQVTAVYDQRDALGLPVLASSASRFGQVASMLRARLKDPEFLWQLAQMVDLSLTGDGGAPLGDDSSSKAKVAALLGPTLRPTFDRQGQTLSIVVRAEDALTAKRLADAAMELFIQQELRFEAETYHRLYEAHSRFLTEARASGSDPTLIGPPVGEGEPGFMDHLEERVRELDLERRRLTMQIDKPTERTRLRVTVPATYDDVPTSRPARRWGIVLGVISTMAILGIAFLRERTTPWARSAGRVSRELGVPVIAEIPKQALKSTPRLTVAKAAALREASRRGGRRDPTRLAWQTFQETELALRRVLIGPVVLVAGAGRTSVFLHNLITVMALGAEGVRLVIDGDEVDPMANGDERRQGAGDLGQFLSGQRAWKDVRLSRTSTRAYDLVLAPAATGQAAVPRQDLLARLFTSLCKGYAQVFVRAHDAQHVTENAAFAATATDVILVVHGRLTRLTSLKESVESLGRTKVRGIILLDV